jgi:outer membrane protein TolC
MTRGLLPITVWLVCTALLAAQEKPPPAPIPIPSDQGGDVPPLEVTIEEALALGIRNNADLRAAELEPLQVAEDLRGARSIFEPELFANGGVSRSRNPSRNVFQPSITRQTYSGTAGVRQLVPSGGLLDLSWSPTRLEQDTTTPGFPTRQFTSTMTASITQPLLRGAWTDYTMRSIHIQESAYAAARQRYQRTVQETLVAIVQGYWELVFARENYRVVHQALDLAQEQLRITNERIRVQELAPLDRVEDEAEVARRREELVIAENTIRDQEDVLRRLLFAEGGELWMRPLRPISPMEVEPDTGEVDWRGPAAVGLRERPDLAARRAEVAIAETQLEAAARDVLPRLDLVGSYASDGVRTSFDAAWDDLLGLDFPDWSLRLELSVPIGNQGALAARDRARLEVERSKRLLYSAELDVVTEVRQAVRRLRTLAETIVRGRESVRLAETNLSREQERLRVGDSTRFLVQQRNQELQEARSRLLRNLLDYRIAEVDLLHAQGILAPPGDGAAPRGEPNR